MRRMMLLVAVVALTIGCADKNDGAGDAPIKGADDTPWSVLNAPDRFPNVAFRCLKGNGIYTTRSDGEQPRQLEVVPNDPACAGQPK